LARGEEQLHMIGHQHAGVHRTREAQCELLQMPQIDEVVLLGERTRSAIIAALDNMQRYIGKRQASTAGTAIRLFGFDSILNMPAVVAMTISGLSRVPFPVSFQGPFHRPAGDAGR
jgi:hypothetical protein